MAAPAVCNAAGLIPNASPLISTEPCVVTDSVVSTRVRGMRLALPPVIDHPPPVIVSGPCTTSVVPMPYPFGTLGI